MPHIVIPAQPALLQMILSHYWIIQIGVSR
jgi:hypothetical protein